VVLKAMRRYPEHRYQSAEELLRDLEHLDELDPASFDLSPEPPMGGMAAIDSAKRLWAFVGLVAVSFIGSWPSSSPCRSCCDDPPGPGWGRVGAAELHRRLRHE